MSALPATADAEQTYIELTHAHAERAWPILNSAAIRLHALSGHLMKAVERRK